MSADAVTRWFLAAMHALPMPLHRKLDQWSRSRAQKRRERRLRLAAQRVAR